MFKKLLILNINLQKYIIEKLKKKKYDIIIGNIVKHLFLINEKFQLEYRNFNICIKKYAIL